MKHPLTTLQLKQMNTELLKTVLKQEKYCTKPDLARLTGLSVSTCGNILNELLQTQEVLEIEAGESTGGRPARVFMFNEEYASIASIYARKENDEVTLVCAVSNLMGMPIFEKVLSFNDIGLREIKTAISLLLEKFPNIEVLGLGLPAVIHQGRIDYSDFPLLMDLDIVKELEMEYPIQVVAENDVNATAMGYHKRSQLTNQDHIAYIYYPENGNAGAGLVVNGQILHGAHHFAGEVSFLPLGVAFQDQGPLQEDNTAFAAFVDRTLQAVNCILNPNTIILSGRCFTNKLQQKIREEYNRNTLDDHRPRLVFEADIHENYLYGLTMIALDKLSCRLQIVERR